ncbi:MAG TPA: pyridoxal phosphate-dependent aminotransferase [Acidisoma sp.]|uniref:pyridoxal phosphate-dependent aminotransferase n=1 Tax=Acidisoma sp. TaxID=1872115 RepID=UPI002C71995C|nr:pyridoxal phosphate-dependent aminotransferase [Acidisoma sp.]HTI00614.1 pyridoxal phosphate-dependent aminotransferase [Acidisoma sp.]
MPALSERLGRAETAAAVQMSTRAREMRAAGHNVISLAIGEPDFATPEVAIEAAAKAAHEGLTKYPPVDGLPLLKAAIQRKFARDQKIDFALNEIVVSNGGKQAIFNAFAATVDEGDEVVIPAPYWSSYALTAQFLGGVSVPVSCPANNGFRLRPEDLDAAITPRTKWVVLNAPNNPTGAAYSAEQLAALAAVLERHPHVWIFSDEIYEHLRYDGAGSVSIAAVAPGLRDRTVVMSGVSKTYAMTGWRIGFSGGPAALIRAMTVVQSHTTAGISTVGQAAAAAVLDAPQAMVGEMVAAYHRRRDMVVGMLRRAPGLTCAMPEGAFYVFPSVAGCLGRTSAGSRRIETDRDFAMALLEEAHVALVHGAAFGMSPYVRISYATDDASLEDACSRIIRFCETLR